MFFFFNDTATTEIYTLSLHDALPIFERLLGAPDPAHAVREPGRAEARLPEAVALAPAAQDGGVRHAHILEADLAMIAVPGHGLHVAHDRPARRVRVDEEGRVARPRRPGGGIPLRDHDRERRAARARDEPLVAVQDPVVAVAHGRGADAGRVRARHFRLGHREAGADPAVDQRAEVALLLLGVGVVEERVHVAFV